MEAFPSGSQDSAGSAPVCKALCRPSIGCARPNRHSQLSLVSHRIQAATAEPPKTIGTYLWMSRASDDTRHLWKHASLHSEWSAQVAEPLGGGRPHRFD